LTEISFRGGSKLGWIHASWPFAKLTASSGELTLATLGTFVFTPEQVIAHEPVGSIPVLARGIRIVHTRPDYPQTIIFWYLGSREKLLTGISEAGFVPRGSTGSFAKPTGFPVRWSVIGIWLVIWNGLLLVDRTAVQTRAAAPGFRTLLALLGTFGLCWGTLKSKRLQTLVLRDGHYVAEIRPALLLMLIVTAILSMGFTIEWIASKYSG
jgi:hypothetical protein